MNDQKQETDFGYEAGYEDGKALVYMDMKQPVTFCSDSPNIHVGFDPARLPRGEGFGTNIRGAQARWPRARFKNGIFQTRSSRMADMLRGHAQFTPDKGRPGFWEEDKKFMAEKSGRVIAVGDPSPTPALHDAVQTVQKIPRKLSNAGPQLKALKLLADAYQIVNLPDLGESPSLPEISSACYAVIGALQRIGVIAEDGDGE